MCVYTSIFRNFVGDEYSFLTPRVYIAASLIIVALMFTFGMSIEFTRAFSVIGALMMAYGGPTNCVRVSYDCGDYETVSVPITIPSSFSDRPVMLYLGLSGFYSGYLGIRNSFSNVQIQAIPRSDSNMPYSGCSGLSSLSDVVGVSNLYVPIDAFASDKGWKSVFNLTEVESLTLRPCGAFFYWIPTDSFQVYKKSDPKEELVISTSDLSWDELNIPSEAPGQRFPYIDDVTNEFVWADPSTQRFRAWRRANVGSEFLVKAGEFSSGVPGGSYTIKVSNCRSLNAEKFVDFCTTSWIGIDQTFLASIFFAFGSIFVVAVIVFLILGRSRPLRK